MDNTGPIQEIQQETEVVMKEDHRVFYYYRDLVSWTHNNYVKTTHKIHLPNDQHNLL